MPKLLANNKINFGDSEGRILQHDLWLDQDLKQASEPTFGNLTITGDATVEGNLYVLGNTSVFDTNVVEFEDNILLINSNEVGNGVTLNLGGFEVFRGETELPYRVVFQESDDSLRCGFGNALKLLAPLSDTRVSSGIATWDNIHKELLVTDSITVDIKMLSSTESTSITSGSFVTNGGISAQKNIRTQGKFITIDSELYQDKSDDNLYIKTKPSNSVKIQALSVDVPTNVPITFASTTERVLSDSVGRLRLDAQEYIDMNATGVRVPNTVPIIFSQSQTGTEVYSGNSHELILDSSNEILMQPQTHVRVPVNIPIVFNNTNQRISSNASNELTILAGNNIILSPGFDVKLPNNKGMKFGDTGNQKLYSNSTNNLYVEALNDILLTPSSGRNVNIPSFSGLTFGGVAQKLQENSDGILTIEAQSKLQLKSDTQILSDTDSSSASTGSLVTAGGLGVSKRVFSETGVTVRSTSDTALLIGSNGGNEIMAANTTSSGNITITAGNGTFAQPALTVKNGNNINSYSLLSLQGGNFDSVPSYTIGRGSLNVGGGRVMSFTLPAYSTAYSSVGDRPKFVFYTGEGSVSLLEVEGDTGNVTSKGILTVNSTQSAANATTGSIVAYGGIAAQRQSFFSGNVIIDNDLATGFIVKRTGDTDDIVNINTNTKTSTVKGSVINIAPSSFVKIQDTNGDDRWALEPTTNQLTTNSFNILTNTTDTTHASNGSLVVSGGVAIQKGLRIYGQATMFTPLNMANNTIENVPKPSIDSQVANKEYVDLLTMGGLNILEAATVATTTNIALDATSLQPSSSVDNFTISEGDRVLVWLQNDPIENGIYIVPPVGSAPTRASDLATNSSVYRVFVFVSQGDEYGYISFVSTNEEEQSTVDTDGIVFVQFYGNTKVSAGSGLRKLSSRLDVVVDDFSLEIDGGSDALRIKSSGLGTGLVGGSGVSMATDTNQSHIQKVGTLDTGIWQASTIQVQYGGTGQSHFTSGTLLFGAGTQPLSTSEKLYWDDSNLRLGIGTNIPSKQIDIVNTGGSSIKLSSDISGTNASETSSVLFESGLVPVSAELTLVRTNNQLVNGSLQNAFLLSHKGTDSGSTLQFATNSDVRMTVTSDGNVGIGTTSPESALQVQGDAMVQDQFRVLDVTETTSITSGAAVFSGGLGVSKSISCGGDLQLFGSSTSISFLSNESNDAEIVFGTTGLSIFTDELAAEAKLKVTNTSDATNSTTASLLTLGGAVVSKSLIVGDNLQVSGTSHNIGDIYFLSNVGSNFNTIKSGNQTNFADLNFGTDSQTIFTILDNGILINNDNSIQIGGSSQVSDGFDIKYSSDVLRITPINNGEIYFGNELSSQNVTIFGTGGDLKWNKVENTLSLSQAGLILKNQVSTLKQDAPDSNNTSFVTANDADIELNFGQGGTAQLKSIFSNKEGTQQIVFDPYTTHGTLTLSSDISTTFNGTVEFINDVLFSGNRLSKVLENTSNFAEWYFIGKINTTDGSNGSDERGYIDLEVIAGTDYTENHQDTGLQFIASTRSGNLNAKHLHFGQASIYSESKPSVYVYQDGSSNYYAFARIPSNSKCMLLINFKTGVVNIKSEGFGGSPSGTSSGYTNSWIPDYNTGGESTLRYTFGDLTSEGKNFFIADNFPVISYNNSNVFETRDLGILFQRFQYDNDLNDGDVVKDTSDTQAGTLPSQSGITELNQIRLDNSTGVNYTGWWLKITSGINQGQVRKISSYQSSTGVATLITNFTDAAPSTGNQYQVYKRSFVSMYYDELQKSFVLSYIADKPKFNENVVSSSYADLVLNRLLLADQISIQNNSLTSIETNGGAVLQGSCIIGQKAGIGTPTLTPEQTLHLKDDNSNILLEHTGDYSFIHFKKTGTSSNKGILYDSTDNTISFTTSSSNQTPDSSLHALTINNSGYIGINATSNISSPLTLNGNSLISTTVDTGHVGLVSAPSNSTSDTNTKIVCYGKNHSLFTGDVHIQAGQSGDGNVRLYTDGEQRLRVNNNGIVEMLATFDSTSSYEGSLVVYGGVSIDTVTDATTYTQGGALTISGGASIEKSVYVGSDLTVRGDIFLPNAVGEATVLFDSNDFVNCAYAVPENQKVIGISSEVTLTFLVQIIPTKVGENTEVSFSLPERIENLVNRSDVIASCSGWTEVNNELIILQNILATGIPGTTKSIIKFQSATTSTHYIQVMARYTSN
jgi:hypothetical protein